MAVNNSINNETSYITIDPGASSAYVQFDINTANKFRIGNDSAASDAFKLSQGSALGTNDCIISTDAGEITYPLQDAFLVTLGSDLSNVTGNGTLYTVVWNSEIFDQASDMTTTTFTAAITARYCLHLSLTVSGLTSSHVSGILSLVTSNQNYQNVWNPYSVGVTGQCSISMYVLTDMDAADTLQARINIQAGTLVVDLQGSAGNSYNYMGGGIAC